jgi:hypothetical protein
MIAKKQSGIFSKPGGGYIGDNEVFTSRTQAQNALNQHTSGEQDPQ